MAEATVEQVAAGHRPTFKRDGSATYYVECSCGWCGWYFFAGADREAFRHHIESRLFSPWEVTQ